jgi:hypothetical protein
MPARPSPFILALGLSLTSACPSQSEPTGPTPEEVAAKEAADAAAEEERKREIEQARVEFNTIVDAAKAALEAEPTLEKLTSYVQNLSGYERLEAEVAEGVDLNPHFDAITATTTAMLESRLAEWSKKKSRTPELAYEIKSIYGIRIWILAWKQASPSEYVAEGSAMLAMGPLAEWKIGDGPKDPDTTLVTTLAGAETRSTFLELCKSALDQAIADDKKDTTRHHYVMETCVPSEGNWEEELNGWAAGKPAAKSLKSFIKAYTEIRPPAPPPEEAPAEAAPAEEAPAEG